jgi:hypothetical protein
VFNEIGGTNAFSSISGFVVAYIVRSQNFCGSLGIMGLFALIFTAFRRDQRISNRLLIPTLLPLCSIWISWALLMQNHYIVHEYQLVLATPILAVSIAYLYSVLIEAGAAAEYIWTKRTLSMLAKLALPVALLCWGISSARITSAGESGNKLLANFGRVIQNKIPVNAIVLTNEFSMVPVYYARRHIIRGIPDGAYVDSHFEAIKNLCSSCSIYLALTPDGKTKFTETISRIQQIFADDNFIIGKIR